METALYKKIVRNLSNALFEHLAVYALFAVSISAAYSFSAGIFGGKFTPILISLSYIFVVGAFYVINLYIRCLLDRKFDFFFFSFMFWLLGILGAVLSFHESENYYVFVYSASMYIQVFGLVLGLISLGRVGTIGFNAMDALVVLISAHVSPLMIWFLKTKLGDVKFCQD